MDRKAMRQKSNEFVQALVKKSQEKDSPADPNYGEKDMEKIKKITQELKDDYSAKKNIRSTKSI